MSKIFLKDIIIIFKNTILYKIILILNFYK